MIRHLSTGQVARALRSACLPILCFLLLPIGLLAQSEEANPSLRAATGDAKTANPVAAAVPVVDAEAIPSVDTKTDAETGAKAAGKAGGQPAANPAAEPNTLMLLGTGIVVLVLLYTRRRIRVLAPRAQPQP